MEAMMEYGYIVVHTRVVDEEVVKDYEWRGAPLASVDPYFMRGATANGMHVTKGNLRFKVLEVGWAGEIIIMREGGSLSDFFLLRWVRLVRYAEMIEGRILRTLAIWNLLEYSPGTRLSWGDLKIYRSLTSWFYGSQKTNDPTDPNGVGSQSLERLIYLCGGVDKNILKFP